ncbi:hypothetical protein HDU83_008363 [Entophlyctis luteolus]|nr:hypothetical protein HDU83_008363 [Entophlyctis luteolus]
MPNANVWLVSAAELRHPASLTDTDRKMRATSLAEDREGRAKAARFIASVGLPLKLCDLPPVNVIASAQVFMHRFYLRESFRRHRYQDVCTAALFLATKVEETARRLKLVIQFAAARAMKTDIHHKIDETSKEFRNWWDNTLYYEELILSTLCWDLDVDYPYEWILKLCKLIEAPAELKASAWAIANDSYRLPYCLQYKSQDIACACMTVASLMARLHYEPKEDPSESDLHTSEYFARDVAQNGDLIDEALVSRFCESVGSDETRVYGKSFALKQSGYFSTKMRMFLMWDVPKDIAENVIAKGMNPGVIHYSLGNIVEGLSFRDNSFDFVYQRHLVMGLPKREMPTVLAELIRVAKNGAWIELLEPDILPLRTGPVGHAWDNALGQAMTTRGLDVYAGSNLIVHLKRFSKNIKNVGSKTVSIPLNWNGAIGKALALDMRAAIIGLEDWMHQVLGKSRQEFREMTEQIIVEWGEYKSFGNAHCVWFQVVK